MAKFRDTFELVDKVSKPLLKMSRNFAHLDKAIEKYSEAMKLAKGCSDKLNDATLKVNKILKENGSLEDFEIEE